MVVERERHPAQVAAAEPVGEWLQEQEIASDQSLQRVHPQTGPCLDGWVRRVETKGIQGGRARSFKKSSRFSTETFRISSSGASDLMSANT